MNTSTHMLLFFVKHPTPGTVKTRLARTMGDKDAAKLYDLFVRDMLDSLAEVPVQLVICHDPMADEKAMRDWLGNGHTYLAQQGGDLGERMAAAFEWAFDQGAERVGLLGSDVPDYPPALLRKAFAEMFRFDAVLGPAMDGGYYFIGFRAEKYLPEVFDGMPWSGPDVYERTRAIIKEKRLELMLLPEWNDVDVFRDLNVLYRLNRNSSFRNSRTYKMLAGYEERLAEYDIDLPGFANPEDDIRRDGE